MLLSACTTTPPQDEPFSWPPPEEDPFYRETLTIAVFNLAGRIEGFAERFERMHPGTSIEVMEFECIDSAREQISLETMAGNPPNLVAGYLVDYLNPMAAANFIDWLPIMYADPYFNEDDWFMGVFDALTHNGRLLGFPVSYDLSVGNSFYLVNSTVPGLAQEFAGRQTVSTNDLIEISERFETGMYMDRNFDVLQAVIDNIDNFLDFETRRVQFDNPEFINLITNARQLTSPSRHFGEVQFFNWIETGNRQAVADMSRRYLFRRFSTMDFDNFGVFEEEMLFINPLPYTNDMGELLIWPDLTFALSSNTTHVQQAMAMEFLRFLLIPPTGAMNDPDVFVHHRLFMTHSAALASPARTSAEVVFPHAFVWHVSAFHVLDGWRMAGEGWPEAIDTMVRYTTMASEMPMRDTRYAPAFVRDIVFDILYQFHYDLITAEQAAHSLQNRITLIIMEMG